MLAAAATRFLQLAAVSVLFGLPCVFLYVPEWRRAPGSSPRWPVIAAFAIAFLATIFWLMAEAANLSGDPGSALDLQAIMSLITETRFGKISALRAVLFFLLGFLIGAKHRDVWPTVAISGGVLAASFAWTGHGAIDDGIRGLLHVGADVIHLLAAGIWVGALVALSLLVLKTREEQLPAREACLAFERFSGIGPAVVAVLLLSGLVNAWFLVGTQHWRELIRSPYGVTLLVKLGLFVAMLFLAASNRYLLVPKLARNIDTPKAALNALQLAVGVEAVLGFFVLMAAAILGNLEPLAAE